MIVTDSRHPADRDVLDAWSRRERVTVVDTYDAVFDDVRRGGAARAYVMDVDGWPPGGARELSQALRVAETEVPLILRTDLSRRALAELPYLAHSESLRRLRLSFRGHEPLDAHLRSESGDDPGCATFEILKRTIEFIPHRERHVWVATVVVCRRKGRRAAVEGCVAMRKDKLRAAYNRWGLPPFPDVHAELLCAHLLAAVEAAASVDACAARAGVSDATALDNYLERHFKCRFAQLAGERTLAEQIECIAGWFGHA